MAESILDRLDLDPGGARRYLASLYAYGATHEQCAQKLAERFGIPQPSKRILGEWRRNDAQLRAMVEELEAARREVSPDADPADVLANVPAPVNKAQLDADLFSLAEEFPAFADLMQREAEREQEESPTTAWGAPVAPPADPGPDDDAAPADDLAVLLAEHETAADFEAECLRRLGDYQPDPA